MSATRTLPVTGGHNLRDLGGYTAAGSRTLKWLTLYRSGAIYSLTADDRAHTRQPGITAPCETLCANFHWIDLPYRS
jgi:protein-tyrosine phosphatase